LEGQSEKEEEEEKEKEKEKKKDEKKKTSSLRREGGGARGIRRRKCETAPQPSTPTPRFPSSSCAWHTVRLRKRGDGGSIGVTIVSLSE